MPDIHDFPKHDSTANRGGLAVSKHQHRRRSLRALGKSLNVRLTFFRSALETAPA